MLMLKGASANLRDVVDTLNELGVHWWLEAGSCLGAIREGNFIGHDTDIDFGITELERIPDIINSLISKGFILHRMYGEIWNGFEFAVKRDGVKVDFFCFYEERDNLWHSAYKQINGKWQKRRYIFPKRLFTSLRKGQLAGVDVWVPSPPKEYLTLRYGDWQTPNAKWDWWDDPLCIERPKTIITYGTFDLLHHGHVRLLERARDLGSRLVVGVSTDSFNKKKGKTCTYPYSQRKAIVEALACVDEVFPESSWRQKADDIKKYGAQVFVMGDDWKGKFDDLPCEVVYLPRTPGISTTETRQKLAGDPLPPLEDVTLLVSTFERPECLQKLLESIQEFYPDIKIMVADDSKNPEPVDGVDYHILPFDSGLSKKRNYLVSKVKTPYVVILDDDFVFTAQTNLGELKQILETTDLDLISGAVITNGKRLEYHGLIEVVGDTLNIVTRDKGRVGRARIYDLVLNFFMARTESLKKVGWDDNLKVAEHLDFFLRAKGILKSGYTPRVKVLNTKDGGRKYYKYRHRGKAFTVQMMNKHGLGRIVNPAGTSITLSRKDRGKLLG